MVVSAKHSTYGSGSGDGSGYGSAYGFAYGSGDGYGDGYGYGSAYGYGYGYGYGSAYGFAYGSGSGYGDGYGYGSAYGSGDGYSDGSGSSTPESSEEFLSALLLGMAGDRGKELVEQGCLLAVWKSTKDGKPANHTADKKPRSAGTIEEVHGPLELQTGRALHGSLKPSKWNGERYWIAAYFPPVHATEDEDKIGSLKREIICEIDSKYFVRQ